MSEEKPTFKELEAWLAEAEKIIEVLRNEEVVPVISRESVLPLRREEAAEKALQNVYDVIERGVEQRTADLRMANERLEQEIEERKRAEAALCESERRYRMLVETMNDGVVMIDENMLLTFVNDRFCQMLGYSQDELSGRPGLELHDEANQRILREQMVRRRQGEHDPYEIAFTCKEGQQDER